jgi:hypothetical protein
VSHKVTLLGIETFVRRACGETQSATLVRYDDFAIENGT